MSEVRAKTDELISLPLPKWVGEVSPPLLECVSFQFRMTSEARLSSLSESENGEMRPSTASASSTLEKPKITTITSRHVISKLELPTADPRIQLALVSSKVFELSPQITLESQYAEDPTKWIATDEIYDQAKGTYQSIIEPFTELPRVYKFESTSEKLYQYRLSNLNSNMKKPLRTAMSSRYLERYGGKKYGSGGGGIGGIGESEYLEDQEDYQKKKKKTFAIEKLTPEEREEYELETIINPFDPPKPWVRKTRLDGEVVYVNEETKQVKTSAPGEVWAEKYKNLEKLVLR